LRPRSPRVGYVLKVYPRFSETFVVNEILAHERAGADLEVFSLRAPVEGRFHEMLARVRAPVTYLPSGSLRAERLWADLAAASEALPGLLEALEDATCEEVGDVHQALLLALEVRRRGIEHLHAHFGSVATTVARLAARFAGVPYSFTAHAKDIFWDGVDGGALTRKLRDAAAVVTVSDYNVGELQDRCPSARIHRIYNGLELERFPYAGPGLRDPLIVGVGRLVEKKGFGDLVDACALLVARGRSFRCQIAGAGPLEQQLRRQVDALGLAAHVELVGPRSQDEVVRLLRSGVAFAAPCVVGEDGNRDGLPTVLLEAMALGTPCVSTPVTGIPEAIQDGVTGLLIPERDPRALAAALDRLLADHPLRVRLARAARATVEARFDVDRNAAGMRRVAWAGERAAKECVA
jgi:colanic acid/amylovoran biosynthesis glycosyltransferase